MSKSDRCREVEEIEFRPDLLGMINVKAEWGTVPDLVDNPEDKRCTGTVIHVYLLHVICMVVRLLKVHVLLQH